MIDYSQFQQAPHLSPTREAANRRPGAVRPTAQTVASVPVAVRRGFAAAVVSGVAISAWALFPSTVESGIYVPLPEVSPPLSAAGVDPSAGGAAENPPVRIPVNNFRFMAANVVPSDATSKAAWRGPAQYSTPAVGVTMVPLKAKLQALLILLSSRYGDRDLSALIEKLRALLELPDSAVVAVLALPEMAHLNTMIDAAATGAVDLPALKVEMGKIQVTSAPETPYRVDVAVNGKPTASVDMRYAGGDPVGSPVAASSASPAGFVDVEPGVSIIASAVTAAVLRSVAPVAVSSTVATVEAEAFASTLVIRAPETAVPTAVMVAPETLVPAAPSVAPETFAPTYASVAPETFAKTYVPVAPETFAPTYVSVTPEPSATYTPESTPTQTDDEGPGTAPGHTADSPDDVEHESTEQQSGQDDSPASDDQESSGSTSSPGPGDAGGNDDSPSGGEPGGGDPSSGGGGDGDGSGGGDSE